MKIRLNKYIADCGVTSRRKADELIDSGQVTVNGRRVFELGTQVDPSADKITVKGRPLNSGQKKIYIAFNKPPLVLTSTSDPEGRPTVSDYFSSYKERLYPVGRLDWDSEGLLLMTNDGDFAQEVAHPKKEIPKTYLVKVEGNPTDNQLDRLKRGVTIIGGKVKALHVERIRRTVKGSGKYQWVKIVISEGKNRQVRRMFEKIGYGVSKLQRVAIGRLSIGKLRKGEFYELKAKDLHRIFSIPLPAESAPAKKVRRTNKNLPKRYKSCSRTSC